VGLGKVMDLAFEKMLSNKAKEGSERLVLVIAIISYLAHLLLIFLATQGFIPLESKFLKNPIAAIYTPFSFILIYEVYLLIFFLPKSISYYIGKQYEIITLIVIRRIFKDIAGLELTAEWFHIKNDLQFTYDVITALVLFALIYFFYREIRRRNKFFESANNEFAGDVRHFVNLKKRLATLLVPILVLLAVFSLYNWFAAIISDYQNGVAAFRNINNVFFEEFFTVLIIIDVLLLLVSFFHSDEFYKIIRNSGFVISTILIKVSFSVEGIVNNALIVGAVFFGFVILFLHNRFEKDEVEGNEPPR
jgi:hypothetical protein